MRLDAQQIKNTIRRHGSRQKRNLIHRAINPARYCGDLLRVSLGGSSFAARESTRPIHVALISDLKSYCSEQQFNPFSTYRKELRDKLRLVSLHFHLQDVLRAPLLILS